VRSFDIEMFYTDFGVLPRYEHARAYRNSAIFSLHLANGTVGFIATLFVVQAAAAVALLVGYRTRLAQGIAWFLLVSLHHRNPMVLQGGDIVLRLLLFWSLVLPLGACWSCDSRRGGQHGRVFNVGVLALLAQVTAIYWYGLVLKAGSPWRDGTAVHFALHIDQFATPFGIWIRQYSKLTQVLTYTTLILEFLGPALLVGSFFLPSRSKLLRGLAVLLMVPLHIGFGLGLELGLFPVISILCWVVWLPTEVWDWLQKRLTAQVPTPVLDGHDSAYALPRLARWCWGLIALYAILWNNNSVPKPPQVTIGGTKVVFQIPAQIQSFGRALGLEQQWNMFAPKPFVSDGWYVVVGETKNASLMSLWPNRSAVTLDKPESVAGMYSSQRWRKYWMNLWYPRHAVHRGRSLDYACRRASRDDAPVDKVYMLYVEEPTSPPDEQVKPLNCRILHAQKCDGKMVDDKRPLPAELVECDRLAWSTALASAAEKVCRCDSNDITCQSREWRRYASAVERYTAQLDRGTTKFALPAASESTREAIKRLKDCADSHLQLRLH
jgi:hypothetical protein